jgi:hypothetical protein
MDSLAISFIDYGDTRGGFTYSLANSLLKLQNKIDITHILRKSSSNIVGNRFYNFREFLQDTDADWLLCIDSDIIFLPEHIETLWDTRSDDKQVITGIYFLLPFATNVVPFPFPAVFTPTEITKREEEGKAAFLHPLPDNQIIPISRAGFGFLLLSRKAIEKVFEYTENKNPFVEVWIDDRVIGEDFIFFENLEKAGIQSFAHTGVIVNHEKVITITHDYYRFFWKHIAPLSKERKQNEL